MKINVLGGGPAGLYSALLLKKTHPAWDVSLIERNPRDATYGWGVVFSDRTLTGLREADYPTYTAITDSFVLWEAIDIHFRDRLLRCDGHAFAGIGRKRMLNILQARCEELGVELRFETELDDPARLRDADLLIAADGVNSRTRALYADTYKTSSSEGAARYIWFGTDKVYDSFTFLFRESEHGLFQVHAYPFDATTSTFIVETREETWRAAGLDTADEAASLAFCQALFADHLGQHRLMSNRSAWLTFQTLKCRRWSHENVVLLGDSAHTAHFSIGSGTKLALEDAIALSNAFEEHDTVPTALRSYEQTRRPRVEATQRAAVESQRYFETVSRYAHVDPEQFAFHLLTRSGRITYDNLKQRDPYFVADVERWFLAANTDASTPLIAPQPMFAPLQLRDLTVPNRAVFLATPTATDLSEVERLGRGGAGLILAESVAVEPDGRITPDNAGLYDDAQVAEWKALIDAIHASSATKIGVSLSHAGRRGATRPRSEGTDRPLRDSAWPLLSASPIPYTSRAQTPRTITCADMQRVTDAFVTAAQRADAANLDLIHLDMSRGYLLASFLSPLTNQRDDEFGGDLANRLRYPLAVLDAVRATWPREKPIAVALSASDRARGGNRIADTIEIARTLKAHGCDLITLYAGQAVSDDHADYDFATFAQYSDIVRIEAGIATLSTAYATTSNHVNTLLAGGRADMSVLWVRR